MDENMTFAVGSKTSLNLPPKNYRFSFFHHLFIPFFSSNDPSKGGFCFSFLFLGFQLSTLVFLHFGFSTTWPEAETKSPNLFLVN
jgi:hypothetical protein